MYTRHKDLCVPTGRATFYIIQKTQTKERSFTKNLQPDIAFMGLATLDSFLPDIFNRVLINDLIFPIEE